MKQRRRPYRKRVRRGDVLVIAVPANLTQDRLDMFTARAGKAVGGTGIRVLIVAGADVHVAKGRAWR